MFKKKLALILITLSTLTNTLYPQELSFEWARFSEGFFLNTNGMIHPCLTVAKNSVYTTAYHSNGGDINLSTIPSNPDNRTNQNSGSNILKHKSNGDYIWGHYLNNFSHIVLDSDTNEAIYCAGRNQGGVTQLSSSNNNYTVSDSALALFKYDANGNIEWVAKSKQKFEYPGVANQVVPGYNINVSVGKNDVIFTILFSETLEIEDQYGKSEKAFSIANDSRYLNMAIAKFSLDGHLKWLKTIESKSGVAQGDVKHLKNGGFILSGNFLSDINIDLSGAVFELGVDSSFYDAFVGIYADDASLLNGFAIRKGNLMEIVEDENSDIWVAGNYHQRYVAFGPNEHQILHNPSPTGNQAFIAKYDSNGSYLDNIFIWVEGEYSVLHLSAIDVINGNNIAFTGYIQGDDVYLDPASSNSTYSFINPSTIIYARYDIDGNYIYSHAFNEEKERTTGYDLIAKNNSLYMSVNQSYFYGIEDYNPDPDKDSTLTGYGHVILKYDICSSKNIIDITTCKESYTVPSGDETYQNSGTYFDTLTNTLGCDSVLKINLTFSNDTTFFNATACESFFWDVDGNTYTNSGIFHYKRLDDQGCEFVSQLNLTVFPTKSGLEKVTRCKSFFWNANGQTYTISGTFSHILQASNGCDSIAYLNLTIKTDETFSEVVSLCDQSEYTWPINGRTYNADGTYTETFTNQFGCDSIHILNLKLLNSSSYIQNITACNNYFWPEINQAFNQSGSYTASFQNQFGCDSIVTLNLTINKGNRISQYETACEKFTWNTNGRTYQRSGNYKATLTNSVGCDSIITLLLTINKPEVSTSFVSLCDQNYTWPVNGQTYSASGIYSEKFTNRFGCDSTEILDLKVFSSNSGSEDVSACEQYIWNGNTYTTSGTYNAILTNKDGCDSTATLNLTIHRNNFGSESITACNSYTWSANNQTYNTSGSYTILLKNQYGCDSTVTLNLTIDPSSGSTQSATACNEYLWSENSQVYNQSGTYTHTLNNQFGCDSLITLDLVILNDNAGSENITACESYTWDANNTLYTQSGTYQEVLQNQFGCDSSATLYLTIHYNNAGSESVTACNNYVWSANGVNYTQSGSYSSTLVNQNGCDSIATLNLTINYSDGSSQAATACDSFLWTENGQTYSQSGNYSHTLQNQFGCDSVITLDLTVNRSNGSTLMVEQCDDTYTWQENGQVYSQSGTYTHVLQNAAGCDSTITLNLFIYSSTQFTDIQTACDSFQWNATNLWYYQSGSYQATLQTSKGCDSIVTLDLNINQHDSVFQQATACDDYVWNGQTYTQSGRYFNAQHNQLGCDSTVVLDLIINSSSNTIDIQSACEAYTWPANNQTYIQSGQYQTTLINQFGCDSNVTLDLNILRNSFATQTETACNSFTWHISGLTYTQSGQYADTIPNASACDSVITLDLTINNDNTGSINQSACDSFFWNDNQTWYYQSGAYQAVLQNQFGCDSVVNLNLVVNNGNQVTQSVTTCEQYTWPTNNVLYTQSGQYQAVLQNQFGCDSVLTLDLTINRNKDSLMQISACDRYRWPVNGQTYTRSTNDQVTLSSMGGCDSTIFLELTIYLSNSGTETVTSCDSYTWAANNQSYTQSGTYQELLSNQNGCDSTAILDLTILNSSSATQNENICGTEFYWNDGSVLLSNNGQYQTILPSANGCDSVITLNLKLVELDMDMYTTPDEIFAPINNDNHIWIFCNSNGDCSNLNEDNASSITPQQNGMYFLAIQKDFCTDTLQIEYTGINCEQPFYIPNAFSPDGDGKNDFFELQESGCNITAFDLKIFNRWGQMVFTTNSIDFLWDGKNKNQALKPGIYTYIVNFKIQDYTGLNRKSLSGTVSILR